MTFLGDKDKGLRLDVRVKRKLLGEAWGCLMFRVGRNEVLALPYRAVNIDSINNLNNCVTIFFVDSRVTTLELFITATAKLYNWTACILEGGPSNLSAC